MTIRIDGGDESEQPPIPPEEEELPAEELEPFQGPKLPPKRSGSTWTEQDYAEHGYRRITIRAPMAVADAFDALVAKLGATRAQALEALLEMNEEESA